MLAMHLDGPEFDRFLEPRSEALHVGPHRVYPHDDPDALAEEIGEVFRHRLEGDYLP